MKARFIAPAQREVNEAVNYYNAKAPRLGDDLFQEIVSATQALCDLPKLWPEIRKNIRRCRLKRFPYSLLYRVYSAEIVVIAVMHDRQRPQYWLKRLKRS